MNPKNRILLRYLPNKIPNRNTLKQHEKKMVMEMSHTSDEFGAGSDKFYDIVRGWWSHFNARIVCSFFVPVSSIVTVGLLFVIDSISVSYTHLTLPTILLV